MWYDLMMTQTGNLWFQNQGMPSFQIEIIRILWNEFAE